MINDFKPLRKAIKKLDNIEDLPRDHQIIMLADLAWSIELKIKELSNG